MRPITRPPMACIQAWPSKPRNLQRRSSNSGARAATAASGCSWAHCSTCIRLRWYRSSIFLPAMAAFKPFPRIPPAARSHLGLVARCARRGRAGVGAGQDCTELAVDLVEPLYLLLDLVALHVDIDRWMPIELLQQPPPRRQRCKEFLLAAVDRRKRLPGGGHGCSS